MGKSQRDKGARLEREVCRDLRAIGIPMERILEFQAHMANGIDLESPNNESQYKIQCKNMAKMPNIPAAMAKIECSNEDIPIVVSRITNKGTYATFKWEDAKILMAFLSRFGK